MAGIGMRWQISPKPDPLLFGLVTYEMIEAKAMALRFSLVSPSIAEPGWPILFKVAPEVWQPAEVNSSCLAFAAAATQ